MAQYEKVTWDQASFGREFWHCASKVYMGGAQFPYPEVTDWTEFFDTVSQLRRQKRELGGEQKGGGRRRQGKESSQSWYS